MAAPVTITGVGLHTGQPTAVHVCPARGGSGRIFRRTDVEGQPTIPAKPENVTSTMHRTQLGRPGVSVSTVEHLLACLHAFGIHDAVIDVRGPEVPICDGSSADFVAAVTPALTAAAPDHRSFVITEAFSLTVGESRYHVRPGLGLSLTVDFWHPHPLIGRQSVSIGVTRETFAQDLAWARTFGMLEDHARLAELGLARGATTDNVLVLDATGVVKGTLRRPDEFVRHKALDLLGDLALVNARIGAHITAEQPGHAGNVALASALQSHARENIEV